MNRKEYLKEYWKTNRSKIKEHRKRFKKKIKKYMKEYYNKHKNKLLFYSKNKRKNHKEKCISYKGNKCSICGYDKCIAALEFHHINPEEKEFNFNMPQSNWRITKLELDKCILLCSNCHRELHYNQKRL